ARHGPQRGSSHGRRTIGTTRSPGRRPATAGPTARTSASASWPITRCPASGGGVPYENAASSRSVPQTPTSSTRSVTLPGAVARGSGSSTIASARRDGVTATAFTAGTSPAPREPPVEHALHRRRQPAAVPGVRGLPDRLGLGRIRMDDARDGAEPDLPDHRERDLRDRLARVRRDQRRAADRPLSVDVDAEEAVVIALEAGAVDVGERDRDRPDRDAVRGGVLLVPADVRDLGRRVRAPRDVERARARAP